MTGSDQLSSENAQKALDWESPEPIWEMHHILFENQDRLAPTPAAPASGGVPPSGVDEPIGTRQEQVEMVRVARHCRDRRTESGGHSGDVEPAAQRNNGLI